MAAERRRKLSEAAVRLARETEEGEAAMKEEMRARKEAAEAKRKDDERQVARCSVFQAVLNRNGNFDLLPKPNLLLWKIPNILPKTKLLPKTEASV